MINVNEVTKTAYSGDSINKTLTITIPNRNITFTNADLVSQSMELTESIESEKSLTFKGCIASQFKFQVANIVTDLRGQYIEAKIQAGNTQEIPLFKGYIDEQNNQTHEDVVTEFICYDVLYSVGSRNMQSWADSLTYPILVRNFRNSLFAQLGIAQESKTLVNDALAISENILGFLENPTALDLMRWICQLNGVFGQIGRDGKFKYRELKDITEGLYPSTETFPSTTTYPSDENAGLSIYESNYISVEYQPYTVSKITKVAIFDSAGIDEGQAGSGSNVLSISDNPIAFSVDMTRASRNLLAKVSELDYLPVISMKCVGFPYAECGDIYISNTKRNVIRTYILNRTLSGIQALYDTYSSDSDKDQPEYKSTATTYINANRKKVLDIDADLTNFKDITARNIEAEAIRTNQLVASSIQAEQIRADNLIAQSVQAEAIRTNNLVANNISAVNAEITSLSAKEANFENLTAQNFTAVNYSVQNLNADIANLNTVVAKKIDATTVKANYMEVANWTQAGFIKADRISADTITAKIADARTISVNGLGVYGNAYFYGGTAYIGAGSSSVSEVATKAWVTANFKPK